MLSKFVNICEHTQLVKQEKPENTLSNYVLAASSAPVISSLIGMSSEGAGTPLKTPVTIDLMTGDGPVSVQVPKGHRSRWTDSSLEVRQGSGGLFFEIPLDSEWDSGETELQNVSAALRRMVQRTLKSSANRGRRSMFA